MVKNRGLYLSFGILALVMIYASFGYRFGKSLAKLDNALVVDSSIK